MKTRAVILAAGKGTRMKSNLPKVLHLLDGQPMIQYAVKAAQDATGNLPVLVIGHGGKRVREVIGTRAEYVYQREQLGTGHALRRAESLLDGNADAVLVTSGDMPLLTAATLRSLIAAQQANAGPFAMLTVIADNPRGFGRIIRDRRGQVSAIVEQAVATPEQLAIRELNVGAYCFSAHWLWDNLRRIPLSPKGEYYLTDMVEIAVRAGLSVRPLVVENPEEALGINTLEHLRDAQAILQKRDAGPS